MWLRVASVVCDVIHVVSCGQRGARDVSFVFVTCGQRGTRDVSCSSASPSALIMPRCASSKETFLLGHNIGRNGSSHDEERCQAVVDFPPLKEKLHTQQFLGCANWLRGYLPAEYGHAAKVLG